MVWLVLAHVVAFVVDLVIVARQRADWDKDLEILLLRHQLRLLQRWQPRPRLSRWEKLTLAVLAAKTAHRAAGPRRRLDQLSLLFRPETVLTWHRELVRRKWAFARRRPEGRPPIAAELEVLIVGWPTRTRAGATAASTGSSPSSASLWALHGPGRPQAARRAARPPASAGG